jgi:hypothetical protein
MLFCYCAGSSKDFIVAAISDDGCKLAQALAVQLVTKGHTAVGLQMLHSPTSALQSPSPRVDGEGTIQKQLMTERNKPRAIPTMVCTPKVQALYMALMTSSTGADDHDNRGASTPHEQTVSVLLKIANILQGSRQTKKTITPADEVQFARLVDLCVPEGMSLERWRLLVNTMWGRVFHAMSLAKMYIRCDSQSAHIRLMMDHCEENSVNKNDC